jgi:DNA (cytosine-5)-methyltransferase 1
MGNFKNQSDEKFKLLLEFARIINEVKPEIISMENVPYIQKTSIFNEFINTLNKNNYRVDYKVIYGPDYGVPQTRRRFILIASKLGDISFIKPTHNRTKIKIRKFIGNLPEIKAGKQYKKDLLH